MQDRYAGDIGDYGKIALLRCLKEQGFRIGINWYKTDALESEKSENGAYKHNDGKYLIPKDLYKCDKELASILYDISQCDELFIPKGSAQGGRVKAGTRSIHALGGQRIKG